MTFFNCALSSNGGNHFQRALPCIGTLATVASIAAIAIGTLALIVRHWPIPYIGHALHGINTPQSLMFIVGGGLSLLTICIVQCCRIRKKPIQKDYDSLLSQQDEIPFNKKGKVYYSVLTKCFYNSKKFLNKNHLIPIKKLKNGSIFLNTPQVAGKGKDKKVFFGYHKQNAQIVQVVHTIENHPRVTLEDEIYDKTRHHPNFVQRIETIKSNEHKKVLLLECCNGGTLKHPNKNVSIDTKQLKNLFIDYFKALHFLHSHDYLHMDLHNDNLFIHTEKGNIIGKLGDFGTSKKMNYFTQEIDKFQPNEEGLLEAPICCTLIAPEIIYNMVAHRTNKKLNTIDGKADIWALAYTMATKLSLKDTHEGFKCILAAQKHYQGSKKVFMPFAHPQADQQEYAKGLHEYLTKLEKYPKQCSSLDPFDILLWEMLHPNPMMRPSAEQVTKRLAQLDIK